MIQDDIINELQYIPEAKLTELYELIHSFRLRFSSEGRLPEEQQALAGCLKDYTNGYIPTDQAKEQAIMQIIKNCASLPTIDQRSPDEILGYAENATSDNERNGVKP